jgi:eukaryotic-like serine/threonine-protein kinase
MDDGAGAVRRLFLHALDLAPETRAAFIDNSSAPPDVRAAVFKLLRYDTGSETFLQQAVSQEHPLAPNGERFGPYQLGPLLGRGGMGAVFRAERVDGELRQTVAIKIAERGWLDPRAFERFRVERQILASLVHPNIARLLDGGTRDDGLPYLVMEFVDGLRLDQYCDQHALTLAGRLRLFLPLCDAVDYAHRKLIVHRDLKPSNVLVTAEGAPKLLDFGVARVLDAGFDTRTQTVVLTPGFASPEQVRGEAVTTSSDV